MKKDVNPATCNHPFRPREETAVTRGRSRCFREPPAPVEDAPLNDR